jgi:hypothetical protein
MENEKLEKMTVGDVALGYSTILQDIVEQLLVKLVEKNLLEDLEVVEMVTNSIENQKKNIAGIKDDDEVADKDRLIRIYELAIERWTAAKDDVIN